MLTQTVASGSEIVRADASGAKPSRWARALFPLKAGLSALAIAYVLTTIELGSAWQHMSRQNLWLLAAAALIMVLQVGLGAMRWHVILKRLGATPRVGISLQLYYIAAFFNYCVWGGPVSGDVVRAWQSARSRADARTAVNSVILDRVAMLASMAVLLLATAPWSLARVDYSWTAVVPAVLAAAVLVGIVIGAQFERLPVSWHHLRPLRLLQALGSATREIFLRPGAAIPVVALGLATQIAMSLTAFAIAKSLGIGATAFDCLVLMQTIAFITALPISVGGWGVRETAMISLFGTLGVPQSAALVLSVQLGLVAVIVSLPGAVLWLFAARSADYRPFSVAR